MIRNTIAMALLVLVSCKLQGQAVNFETPKTWEELKTSAQKEGKSIFIDFYATWCAPCKAMEEGVFKDAEVAKLMNAKFINIRIQLDKQPIDNDYVKSWYEQGAKFRREFNIRAMPTFIILDQNGNAITKQIGYLDKNSLFQLISEISNPDKQYYTLLSKYKNGTLEMKKIPDLAIKARLIGDSNSADEISMDYINNFLLKLPDSLLFTYSNLFFIKKFLAKTDTKAFELFNNNVEKVNSIIGKNAAQYAIRSAITRDFLPADTTWGKSDPNWDSLMSVIQQKFGSLGLEALYGQKMAYYFYKADWKKFGESYYSYFQTAIERPEYNINDLSFTLFENNQNSKILTFACDVVMKYAMEEWYQNDANAYDTYANLLYKTNRKLEAIKWEERAAKMKTGQADFKLFSENLDKMRRNQPTWNAKDN